MVRTLPHASGEWVSGWHGCGSQFDQLYHYLDRESQPFCLGQVPKYKSMFTDYVTPSKFLEAADAPPGSREPHLSGNAILRG